MDCIVVIGTTLATGYASNLVSKAVKDYVPVIEISTTQVIKTGKNGIHLKGKAEDIVPQLCDKLM